MNKWDYALFTDCGLKWGSYKHKNKRVLKREPLKTPKNMNLLEIKDKKRELSSVDYRVLGHQLDLFSIDENVGVGLVLWHPKGMIVRRIIRDFWEEEHLKNGYQLVCTPHIARGEFQDTWIITMRTCTCLKKTRKLTW